MESPLSDIRIGMITDQWAKTQKIVSHYSEITGSTNATTYTYQWMFNGSPINGKTDSVIYIKMKYIINRII